MLSQVNYRVPNMRFLRERLTVRACGPDAGGWGGGQCRPPDPGLIGSPTLPPGAGAAQQRHHLRTVCTTVPQPHVQRPEDGA